MPQDVKEDEPIKEETKADSPTLEAEPATGPVIEAESEEKEKPPNPAKSILDNIPLKFATIAQKLLERLEDFNDISWDPETNQVSVDKISQGITIQQFIKAVCVPFTTIKLPIDCVRFLDRHSIKTRNHLANLPKLPPWHPYFRL